MISPLVAAKDALPRAAARAALVAAAALAAFAAPRRTDPRGRLAIAGLALMGQLEAGRGLARAASRELMPLTLLAAVAGGRHGRRFAIAVLVLDVTVANTPNPPSAPLGVLLRLVDNCAGIWHGAIAARSPDAMFPRRPVIAHGAERSAPTRRPRGTDPRTNYLGMVAPG